jgi:hypothetical protein
MPFSLLSFPALFVCDCRHTDHQAQCKNTQTSPNPAKFHKQSSILILFDRTALRPHKRMPRPILLVSARA